MTLNDLDWHKDRLLGAVAAIDELLVAADVDDMNSYTLFVGLFLHIAK